MADTKVTGLSEISVPALEDLSYWVDDPAGTPASNKITGYRLGGLLVPQVCQGRLTTESATPVSSSDRSAQSTLYWTPCTPNGSSVTSGLVGFYDGTRYVVLSLTELSLNLDTAEAGGPIDVNEIYDVFIDYAAGTPALVIGPSWTNDTTRATALAKQGSLVVLTGDTDWRWVGTIRASASGDTEDSLTKRFVWNAYNQVPRPLAVTDATSTYTYNATDWRQVRATSTNQVAIVCGAVGCVELTARLCAEAYSKGSGSVFAHTGIGVDWSSGAGNEQVRLGSGYYNADVIYIGISTASIQSTPAAGYHTYVWIEACGAARTTNFYGGNGYEADDPSGMIGSVLA
jgi:hypothetical protein